MIDTSVRPLTLAATRRISWGAIFAGVAIATALQAMLAILGVGIGANALHPSHAASAEGLGAGSAIWLFLTTMLALLAAGRPQRTSRATRIRLAAISTICGIR